jgi:hypothetical protein
MQNEHWKFVGWVDAIDTYGNVWTQRVTESTLFGDEDLLINWSLTKIPLPGKVQEGTFISVHRTKAGEWYAVNLSERMPRITESQHNRAKARGHRRWKKFQKIIDDNPNPEATRG